MRERDRLILIVGVVVAVLIVTWMFWVSPERKAAASVEQQVSAAQSTLSTAQSQLATAQANKDKYGSAYAALVSVGKAVPANPDVPSLIYQLDQASNLRDVEFTSISVGGAGGAGSSRSSVRHRRPLRRRLRRPRPRRATACRSRSSSTARSSTSTTCSGGSTASPCRPRTGR